MIFGSKTRIRAVEKEDLANFTRWLNDRQVTEFLDRSSPLSLAAEERWFENLQKMDSGEVFSIDGKKDEAWVHIGDSALLNIDHLSKKAEFGIFIGEKSMWGAGFGREATRLTIKHGFEDLNLHRIYLYVFEEHHKAIAVYEAIGFQKEGLLRDAIYKNGSYHHLITMSILRTDWDLLNHKEGLERAVNK